jgi:hypothetical protein
LLETGVIVDHHDRPVFWHEPQNRTGGSLPDSQSFWNVIWECKDQIKGIAHTHPGAGMPYPSYEDITTFAGVEAGLGRRLQWWVASQDKLVGVQWVGPHRYDYSVVQLTEEPLWVYDLRDKSNY